ncbi:MAG: lytic transglycosylase domain-containing protein [Acidobacteriota bacterium]
MSHHPLHWFQGDRRELHRATDRRLSCPERVVRLLLMTWLLILFSGTPVAEAELILFANGGFLKVADFELVDEKIRLTLPSGGSLVLPILRIERILEDEVPLESEIEAPPVDAAPAVFDLAFDPSQPVPSVPFADLIYGAGRRHALNPALLAAVVRAESAFQPQAVSHKGAQGLMQLMPATARRFGLEGSEVFEPAKNIDAGARYLSWLAQRFDGELANVLAAYNAGEGTVDRYQGVPPYRETRKYLQRIYSELGLDPSSWSPPPSGR